MIEILTVDQIKQKNFYHPVRLKKEKKNKKISKTLWNLWDTLKLTIICIMGVLVREEIKKPKTTYPTE